MFNFLQTFAYEELPNANNCLQEEIFYQKLCHEKWILRAIVVPKIDLTNNGVTPNFPITRELIYVLVKGK